MPDEDVAHCLQVLYEWAGEGSKLFLCDSDTSVITEDAQKAIDIYERSGQPMHLRPLDRTLELIKPWSLDEAGVMGIEEWLDMDNEVTRSVEKAWGSGALNGMILKK